MQSQEKSDWRESVRLLQWSGVCSCSVIGSVGVLKR